MRKLEQDKFFITIVFEMNDHLHRIKRYFSKKYNLNYDDSLNIKLENKCLSKYLSGNISATSTNYNYQDKLDNDELMYIKLICNNLTLDQMMNRNFFYDYYLSEGIDIKFKEFINTSRYTIGYLISRKIKNERYALKPLLTFQMNNVLCDQDNILVSNIFNNMSYWT